MIVRMMTMKWIKLTNIKSTWRVEREKELLFNKMAPSKNHL